MNLNFHKFVFFSIDYIMEQDNNGVYALSVSEMKEARETEKTKEAKKDNNVNDHGEVVEAVETVERPSKTKESQAVSKDLKFISCPRLEDQEVSVEACQTCSSRQGCPSHED